MLNKLFAPFEIALQDFHIAGGADVMTIRSSDIVFRDFQRAFPGTSYMGIPVRLARAQSNVSVRGPSLTGEILEFPVPAK
jgi:hypothetical protein